jgi:hypothetical protein
VATAAVALPNHDVAHDEGAVAKPSRMGGTTDPTTPALTLLKCPDYSRKGTQSFQSISSSLSELRLSMSATGGFGPGGVEGAGPPKKRGQGRPPGSGKKAKLETEASPSAPRQRGRPLWSKNR